MFNFDLTIMNNINFCEQSTPVNQNRRGNNYLFGNTTTIPPPATPFSSSNLFSKKEQSQILRKDESNILETTTFHQYESIVGLDKINKDDEQTSNHTKIFNTHSFGNSQLSKSSKSTSTLGNSLSFLPITTTTNTPFTFSLSKPTTTSSTTIVPTLFSTMNQPKPSPMDLQLYQTMVNTQPFNNELAFLARNIKPNISIDRARLSTASIRPTNNLFSSVLIKPSISTSKSTKRKYDEAIIDDDDDTLFSTNKISKINIKRPRMLDMNKIRSIILGNNETFIVKSSSTENPIRWDKFSTYDEYISSKKQDIKHDQRSFCLPRLTHHDYYTKPTIEELQSCFNDQGQCFVKQFTIGRKHYGSVTFQGLHMNLSGLDLDRLVEIDRRQVTVYPDDKDRPNEGEELNCQAIISLIGVYPIDRSISNGGEEVTDPNRLIEMNYGKYLEEMTNKFQGHFLDYDVYTGTWRFQVEHF